MLTSEETKKTIQANQEEQDNFEKNQIILTNDMHPIKLRLFRVLFLIKKWNFFLRILLTFKRDFL